MPTRKTIFWLISALVVYLIAWNVGSGWLYILAALLLSYPMASIVLTRLNTGGLELRQSAASEASAGGALKASLEVLNHSRLPRFFLSLQAGFGGGRSSSFVAVVRGRDSARVTLGFEDLQRGIYPGGTVLLASSAPMGLARRRRHISTDSPLVVYPAWHRLSRDWRSGQRDQGHAVASTIPSRCAAGDYLGVRDYRPEDSPRSIHWRTTARSNRLVVVEYARLSTITPVFLVDTCGGGGAAAARAFEALVTAAASLVDREAQHGRRFGLGASPREASRRGLGLGRREAMTWLAGVEASATEPLALDACLPWPLATPVLLLTSHRQYAGLNRSRLLRTYPHSVVIMADGLSFTDAGEDSSAFMDHSTISGLAGRMAAAGVRLHTFTESEDMRSWLERL